MRKGICLKMMTTAFVAFLTTGCITNRTLAANAVDFNLAVEKSQNQMLLLNVLRASKKRPMYLTGISKITGSNSAELTLGLEIPFQNINGSGKGSPSGTFGVNPTYDVPVLDSKEFMTGFLNPIKPELLAYYWDQGWPQELLIHLLVRKVSIRVKAPEGPVEYYFHNRPGASDQTLCELEKFGRWVNVFLEEGDPGFESQETEAPLGPSLSDSDVRSLEDLIAISKENLKLAPDPSSTRFQLIKTSSKTVLEVQKMDRIYQWIRETKDEGADLCQGESAGNPISADTSDETTASDLKQQVSTGMRTYEIKIQGGGTSTLEAEIILHLRSPEGVLYYLGQLARIQDLNVFPRICLGGELEPLFILRKKGTGCSEGVVTAKYDGETYLIPRSDSETRSACGNNWQSQENGVTVRPWKDTPLYGKDLCEQGRSMHALSLLTQLISLQKSAEELLTTSTVRVVGQQ